MAGALYNPRTVNAANLGFSDVKCRDCGVVKQIDAFAKNRLPDLQEAAKRRPNFNSRVAGVITCMQCAPQQVTELTCHMCDETKGLDRFPKTQRRNPDEAMCWTCQEERANFEPDAKDSDLSSHSDDDDGDSDDDSYTVDADYGTDAASSVVGGGVATFSSRSTGGVPVDGSTQLATTTGASSTAATSVTTASRVPGLPAQFNRNAYGNPAKQGSASAPRSTANLDSKKFAKVKASDANKYRTVYDVAERERQEKHHGEISDVEVESD